MIQVAVKIVKKGSVMRYRTCRRLRNEIALTALVDSDHVCKLLETVHTRGAARGVPPGEPFVGESFHGADGYWLTRELLHQRRQGDRLRGDHQSHTPKVAQLPVR